MKLSVNTNRIITYILSYTIIIALVIQNIDQAIGLRILGDEWGYWSAGAYLYNFDTWKEFGSIFSYYGFGYGLILGLLLKLPILTISAYKIAILLNGIIICGIFSIVYYILNEEVGNQLNAYAKGIIALALSFATSTFYYSRFTMSEVILAFDYWLLVFFWWMFFKNSKMLYAYLIILSSFILVSIHLRSAGIAFVSCASLLMIIYKRTHKEPNKIAFLLVSIFVCFFVFSHIKKGYTLYLTPEILETLPSNTSYDGNDISGQIQKILFLLSKDGLMNFFQLFIGRIWYSIVGTFGTVLIALFSILNLQIHGKNATISKCGIIVICNSLFTVLISIVYAITSVDGRMDILTYGRYFEFTLGPILLFGFLSLMETKPRTYFLSAIIVAVLGLIMDVIQNYDSTESHIQIHCSQMYYWFRTGQYRMGTHSFAAASIIAFILAFFILSRLLGNTKYYITIMTAALLSWYIFSANYTYMYGIMPWATRQLGQEIEFYEFIIENGIEDDIYCLYSDPSIYEAAHIQFYLKNYSLHIIPDVDSFIEQKSDKYLLTCTYTNNQQLTPIGFTKVYSTEKETLWKYTKNSK